MSFRVGDRVELVSDLLVITGERSLGTVVEVRASRAPHDMNIHVVWDTLAFGDEPMHMRPKSLRGISVVELLAEINDANKTPGPREDPAH